MTDRKLWFYIDIYFHVSFGGHYLGAAHAGKLKFGMLLTQT